MAAIKIGFSYKIYCLFVFLTFIPEIVRARRQIVFPKRLVKDLLDYPDYDKRVRPVRNVSESIEITVRFNLYQIIEVNEARQYMELYVWVTQSWYDEFLTWDPNEYDGINTVPLPYESVWLPDTHVYNSLVMSREYSEHWINVVATTNLTSERTEIKFQYPAIYRFTCKMGIFYFPFDVQNCTIQIGSWTYDSSALNYFHHGDEVLMEAFIHHEEWKVESFRYSRTIKKYLCCPSPYIWVNAHIVIRRKPLHIVSTLIVPTIVISVISMVGFFMPSNASGERNEKVTLGINTLLAMSILLLNLSHQMPASSESIPLIGWFYLSTILVVSVGTCMTSFIMSLESQWLYGKRIPEKVKKMFVRNVGPLLMLPPLHQKPKEVSATLDEMENSFITYQDSPPGSSDWNGMEWKHLTLIIDRFFLVLSICVILILNLSLFFIGTYARP